MSIGLIATSCRADLGRFLDNYASVDCLAFESGWEQRKLAGWHSYANKNRAVEIALEKNYSHILFIDDDMVVPPNLLDKLLKHNLDVVSCHLLTRYAPFEPYIYDTTEEDGRVHKTVIGDRQGLIEVKAIGLGGVLVKVDVFKKLGEKNWFEVSSTLQTEDIHFSKKCQDNGIKIHVDLQTMCGHLILGAVWPTFDGNWHTTLVTNNQPLLNLPSASKDEDGTIRIKY